MSPGTSHPPQAAGEATAPDGPSPSGGVFEAWVAVLGRWLGRIALALVMLFLAAPLLATVYTAFSPVVYAQFPPHGLSLRWFVQLWHTPLLLTAFVRSLVVALVVTLLTGLLATAAALGLERMRRGSRGATATLFQAPLIVPQLVFGIALLSVFSQTGLYGTYPGLVLAHVIVAFPFFLRPLQASLSTRERSLEEAAAILGAAPLRVFFTVTVPSIRAGLMSGAVFAFITSFDQFSVSLFVVNSKTVTLPVAIYNYLFQNSDPTVAAVSTVVILVGLLAAATTHRLVGLDTMLIGEGGGGVGA